RFDFVFKLDRFLESFRRSDEFEKTRSPPGGAVPQFERFDAEPLCDLIRAQRGECAERANAPLLKDCGKPIRQTQGRLLADCGKRFDRQPREKFGRICYDEKWS